MRQIAVQLGLSRWVARAARVYEGSNGQVAGQVTRMKLIRMKLIKRQMYGRARFGLLRKRILSGI